MEFNIIPKKKTKDLRDLPNNISIDNTLIDNPINKINQKIMGLKILFSSMFYKEIFSNKIINPKKLKFALISCRDFFHFKGIFKNYLENDKGNQTVFYSYWHTEVSYALQSLKNDFNNFKVVSRVHGTDLYKERRACGYMPLKKQFIDNIDKIYSISDEGRNYLHKTYGFDSSILEVSRLGVEDLNIRTIPTNKDTFHIVSCSYVVDVKRIDKIIDALELLSKKQQNIKLIWTHIGDGEKKETLEHYANNKLDGIDNIIYRFMGYMNNKDVLNFYKKNKIDLFLNVSESEGVPVTIMEAMSCHLPIVAPNVGGISEMISDGINGCLLSEKTEVVELVNALLNMNFFKNENVRNMSYNLFLQKYNATNNYKSFIKSLI